MKRFVPPLFELSWAVHFDPLPIPPATIHDYLGAHPCAMKCKVRMTGKICIAQQWGSKVGSLRTVATWPAHLVVLGLVVITTSGDQYKSFVGSHATFLWQSFKPVLTLLWDIYLEGFAGFRRKSGHWRCEFRWRFWQQASGCLGFLTLLINISYDSLSRDQIGRKTSIYT